MALELKGGDGKWYTHASIDIYRKHRNQGDEHEIMLQLLASIGQELEDIAELLKPHLGD
jgi:hypothetical protein